MNRTFLLIAFVVAVALTVIGLQHGLSAAAPSLAPQYAPPLEQYAANLSAPMTTSVPAWSVVAGGGGRDVRLNGVDMVSPSEGWTVGTTGPSSFGVIMHYTNTTWSRVNVLTHGSSIAAVSMISPTEGWAAGYWACSYGQCDHGLLMHYTAGTGWQTATLPTRPGGGYWNTFHDIDIKGTAGWIVGWGGYSASIYNNYFLRLDGGSWTPITASIIAYGVSVVDANEAWAVGRDTSYNPMFAHYSSGNWSVVVPPSLPTGTRLYGIHMLNADEGWAVGHYTSGGPPNLYQCVTLHYSAGIWSSVTCPGNTRLRSVSGRASNDVWAVGPEGPMLHYTGSSWTQVTLPSGASDLNSVKLMGTDDGWAVGSDGVVLRLINGTWTVSAGSRQPVKSVDALSADEAWYGSVNGELFQWKNRAVVTHTSGVPLAITALDMISPTLGWAGTSLLYANNYILKYADGSWTITPTGVHVVDAISMVSPDEGWFATSTLNGVLHYQAGVKEWQPIPGNPRASSVSMLDPNHGWATAYVNDFPWQASVYTYTDGTWNVVVPTTIITGNWGSVKVMGISPDEAWVAGWSFACTVSDCPLQSHLLHYSAGTWTTIPTPDWLAFYDISQVSATEWWAAGKLTTMEYAFLHYKDGSYTVVPSGGEDVLGVSMLPDGSGFARGVGSLLRLGYLNNQVYLPIVIRQ
jgi:hypothetical protein